MPDDLRPFVFSGSFGGQVSIDDLYDKEENNVLIEDSGNIMYVSEVNNLTYLPEQQIGAWHRHDTQGGAFESVAVVAEGQDDVPYFVVRRQINGQVVRYIECLHSRHFTRQEDAFFEIGRAHV